MNTLENMAAARRARTAQEIRDALALSGMSRKEFADKMHRLPSEVTKWLGGNHNFTTNLLAEISYVLGTPISGAGETLIPVADKKAVDGYGSESNAVSKLKDPASYSLSDVEIPMNVAQSLILKAEMQGCTLREYIRDILCRSSEEVSASDFAGIWDYGYPDGEEIRATRSVNSVELW